MPLLIVAIGASAGGLEAYKSFFQAMPADSGMAFVLVQHLAPDCHSMLPEIVARSTRMDVLAAADGEQVLADHVYVIPPDATLMIADGLLQVHTPAPPRQNRWPIDTFFGSLAQERGDHAVCVVLSGSGSDGTRGLRTIKEHGGLVIAQAGFDHHAMSGMPASAAATGLVDHVVPVERIPALLLSHLALLRDIHAHKAPDGVRQDLTAHVQTIAALVRAETGHDFSQYKEKTIVRRIQRRMQVLQLRAVPEYIALLRRDSQEAEALFLEMLIGVTEFFRDPAAFDALQAHALPALLREKNAADTLRVWVPGCSTGEEAYSIAIALREAMGTSSNAPRVQIFASDIDDRAINFARAGRYAGPLAGISPERQARWFKEDGSDLCVTKAIREMCVFSTHSVVRDPPFSQLDSVSCRNLLIYMDAELQQRLLRTFHYALRPGGYLLLGPSESLGGSRALYNVIDKKHRLFVRRNDVTTALSIFPHRRHIAASSPTSPPRTRAEVENDLERGVRRVLEKFTPAYVVIDGNHEVLRFSGDTGQYLAPAEGQATLNLFALLHKGLRGIARTAVQQALLQSEPVIKEGLSIPSLGEHQPLRLIAARLGPAESGRNLCVVAFDQMDRSPLVGHSLAAVTGDQVSTLVQELELTRRQLHASMEQQETVTEELMSANEEYQSVNEELQSSNEELETSKEEMQSINEELQVINAEIGSKNETLSRVNSDLQNLMDSTQIATLFLDATLRVTGFTSGMREVFHLRDSDRGRPITDIATRIAYPQMRVDVEMLQRTLVPIERVLHGRQGVPTYLMRARPYRTVDNVIDGAVLTFIDITQREAQQAERARLAAIVESSQDAIIGYDADGVVTSWNSGAVRLFGYAPTQMTGASLGRLLPKEAASDLRLLLQAGFNPSAASNMETIWLRHDGVPIPLDLSFSSVRDADGIALTGSVIARDISERRQADNALRQSETRLNAILEQASMGLAQTNVGGRFELVNPRFCQIVGRTARELYRLRVQDIVHPDDVAQNLALARRLLTEDTHFQMDVRFLRPDGGVVWTSHNVTAMHDGASRPRHLISAVLDITPQKLAQQHVALMLDELNHRVKNTLATVQAIAQQTLVRSTSLDAFRIAFNARLLALSKTHNLLAEDVWTGVQLRDIVTNELAPYLREGDEDSQTGRARVSGGELILTPKLALALSMAIHELATNASKYGALSVPQGEVAVGWNTRDQQGQPHLHLEWRESGGPPVAAPTRRGFGTRLITEGISFELNGEAVLHYEKTGVRCVIDVPLSEGNS